MISATVYRRRRVLQNIT